MNRVFAGLACAGALAAATDAHALSVTTTTSGDAMAAALLGSGVVIVPGSVSYTGATNQSGFFTGGAASGITIESGIIMTTGNANLALEPNNSDSAGAFAGTGGDVNLGGFDKAVLEFDFTTATGDLFFNYVFASEEYNEWTNTSFNDAFALFVDGVNVARIPGTSTPVSINTVNGGNPFGVNASNSLYFNNNDLSNGGPFFDIEYDGFTDVFTAQALDLSPGTHHMKFVIVDRGDTALDSAVFVQAGSFSGDLTDPTPVGAPEPATLLLLGAGLTALGIWRRFRSA